MKTYYAVIEICKLYKEGYSINSFIWQKGFGSRKEAASFIKRVGAGKKDLYSVESATIEIDCSNY